MSSPANLNRHVVQAAEVPSETPNPATSMLNPYIYDVSSLPDQLSQPNPETAAERMARLTKAVDAALVTLKGKGDGVGAVNS